MKTIQERICGVLMDPATVTLPDLIESEGKQFRGVLELECLGEGRCTECRLIQEPCLLSRSLLSSVETNTIQSLNLPCIQSSLQMSLYSPPSPPPSHLPSPSLPMRQSIFLEFVFSLKPIEKELMEECIGRMMRHLVESREDRILLELPAPIPGHNLSLYKIPSF